MLLREKPLDRGDRCSQNGSAMLPEAQHSAQMLQPGQAAPLFDLPDTPGCTMEAIEFSELDDNFGALKTVVLGVSMDDCLSHGAFRDKHGLSVQLLADVDGEVCRRYGVLQEKELEGKLRTCIIRSTFIIDRKGHVMHALYGVSPRGHAEKVLGLLREGAKCK
jgi:peroxiredoxin Q/BCP